MATLMKLSNEIEVTSKKPSDQLEPTVFVIFGGAGDLTWRKLVPALFDLSQDRSLPAQFAIVAVDRIKLGDDALSRKVNEKLKGGYELYGSSFFSEEMMYQAMTKPISPN